MKLAVCANAYINDCSVKLRYKSTSLNNNAGILDNIESGLETE